MGGQPNETTQTTTQQLSPEQRRLIEPTIPIFEEYLRNPPRLPGYSQISPWNPAQLAGQQALLGQVLPQQQVAGNAADALNFSLTGARDVNNNPYLKSAIDAATRPIAQNLMENVLPGIRGTAVATGNLGGSRQGIAEGLAAGRTAQAIGDTSSQMASQGYLAGLDAMGRGLALTPQTLQAMLIPGQTVGMVGNLQYGMEQALLSERAYRDMYEQMAPFLAAQQVAGIGSGLPGGTTVSTMTQPGGQQNVLGSLIGGASLISGLFGNPFASMGAGMMGGGSLSPAALAAVFGGSGGLF